MFMRRIGAVALLALALPLSGRAELETLPIRKVTVFKDGHAFVEVRGEVALDEKGDVSIGNLPSPVMGTFWSDIDEPCRDDGNVPTVELRSVTYQQEDVVDRTPIQTIDGLLHANLGERVRFLFGEKEVQGRIRKAELGGKMAMVESVTGYRLFPVARIESLEFPSQPPVTHREVVRRKPVLKLRVQWKDERPRATTVRVMYLQKGIRWIPSYRIVLRNDGFADIRLQATLVNELVGLEGAEVKLVVGVPSFLFQDTVDPLSGSTTLSGSSQGLSQYFLDGRNERYGLSNALVTQVSRMAEYRSDQRTPAPSPIDSAMVDENEQMQQHVYTLANVDLPRGARQVQTLGHWRLPVREIYKLVVPAQPPVELRSRSNSVQMNRLLEMTRAPKVKRIVRIENTSDLPFTTAPALILDGSTGLLLAQTIMTYASVGGEVDLELTDAIDLQVAARDQEINRTPNHTAPDGNRYAKIDISSRVTITNFQTREVEIEVERQVQGEVDDIVGNGEATKRVFFSNANYPDWYWQAGWPTWWQRLNPSTSVKWNIRVPAAGSTTVGADWHYLWR